MRSRYSGPCVAGFVALLVGARVEAQSCMAPPLSLNTRPGLIGGPCTPQAPAPNPRANGSFCQCVVALTTMERRVVARDGLYQECGAILFGPHYGHGKCPASSVNCDKGHSAPYGNWGVRVRNSTLVSELEGESIASQSREEDCSQWPGTKAGTCGPLSDRRPCAQWHTCNCDTLLDFGGEPPPAFVSKGAEALAGFYVVNSASAECGVVNGKSANIRSLLEVYELDKDDSDLVDSLFLDLPVTLSCTGPYLCQGEAARAVRGQMQRIEADFRVKVRCAGSPAPPPPPGGGGGGGCVDTPGGRCGTCGCRGGCGAGLMCLADGLCHGTRNTEAGLIFDECTPG
ncbi:MAG: hypothetical protein QOH06_4564 [Acidobacteriota bacterium]|nr:hypothetical protein [Acidobacteriota bacterium]